MMLEQFKKKLDNINKGLFKFMVSYSVLFLVIIGGAIIIEFIFPHTYFEPMPLWLIVVGFIFYLILTIRFKKR